MKLSNDTIDHVLKDNRGFTLIEIIIVISLIALAAGLSGYGISVITQSNVESMGHDIVTEFRDLKYRSVSEYDKEYEFRFIYEGGKFGYEIYQSINGATATRVKKKTYRSTLTIQAYKDGVSYVDITDSSFDITDPNRVTYTFDTATGGIKNTSLGGATLSSLPNDGGNVAKYYITDTTGSNFVEITIVGITGRVIVNEL